MAYRSVTIIRQPVEPTGWPSPIPDPFTLVISRFKPRSISQPKYCAAKASLSSINSKSSSFKPGFLLKRSLTAGTGLRPITDGWQAPRPTALILAMGVRPSSSAFSADIMTMALDPSLIPEELPAVTFPILGIKPGGRPASFSMVIPGLKCSSLSKIIGGFFLCGTSMGTISSLKSPFFVARSALLWLRRATSSIASRLILCSCAINSAVCPIIYGLPLNSSRGIPSFKGPSSG